MIHTNKIDIYNNSKSKTDKRTLLTNIFNSIAPVYDFINTLLSFGIDSYWRRQVIKEIKLYCKSLPFSEKI